MKQKTISRCIGLLFFICILVVFPSFKAYASTPYQTYTYSYDGDTLISPAAYEPKYQINSFGEETLNSPSFITYRDDKNHILISDTDNNRILIVDTSFNKVATIDTFVQNGQTDCLKAPQGVFVASQGLLYVADSGNGRILLFDENYNFIKEFPPIEQDYLPENFKYIPKSIAVDRAGNIYVISSNTNMGVIALDPEGRFYGFIGAQRVAVNALELLKRAFMTEEQLARTDSFVPVEYSSLTIDEKGFVYVTCSNIDRYELYSDVWSRSNDSSYAPIKKINPSGTDVLRRNGFFPPVGDVVFDPYRGDDTVAPSQITEVNLLENGMYTLLDSSKNKLFTYDAAGNLLYAFGGAGEVAGLYSSLTSVTYNGNIMYTLDGSNNSITVSEKTEYGVLLDTAVGYQENREFEKANKLWYEIIKKNNNFDVAYLNIGKIHLENGDYEDAMECFRLINNTNYYNKAFKFYRQEWMDKNGILVALAIGCSIFAISKILGKCTKYGEKLMELPATGTLKDELMFGFYSMLHPFQGYWGLKMEKRGSVRGASIYLVLFSISAVVSTLAASYLAKDESATFISALSNTLFPLLLWCISNMAFTSLMDGKGTFKDVYIATCYSTLPYILVMIPCTAIGHLLLADEIVLVSFATGIATIWTIALVFLSGMTIHEYSFGKNLMVIGLSIVGIAFILFILLIFVSLSGQLLALITSIINELGYRM